MKLKKKQVASSWSLFIQVQENVQLAPNHYFFLDPLRSAGNWYGNGSLEAAVPCELYC